MQRILFWLGIILLINWWVRRQSRAAASRVNARREQTTAGAGQTGSGVPPGSRGAQAATRQLAEPMARCGVCGVYIPQSEALQVGDAHFCCAEHARESAKHAS